MTSPVEEGNFMTKREVDTMAPSWFSEGRPKRTL